MNYKKSRDLAWKILVRHKVSSLPVDITRICKDENIKLFTYRQSIELIKKLGLETHMVGNDAFCIKGVIFYDDTTSHERQCFSIAHEIGHIFLHTNHAKNGSVYNREPWSKDPLESEANIFASRLLAPLCVIHALNLNSATEIANRCNISYTAAKIRYQRLCLIRIRNEAKTGGTFFMSNLETKVFKNFEEYIKESKN